jgi:hypothetical protein
VTRLRNSACPAASAPCIWNTCFAISSPMVVTCSMDVSFRDGLTPSPWHADAVGGLHPITPYGASILVRRKRCLVRWLPTRIFRYGGGQHRTRPSAKTHAATGRRSRPRQSGGRHRRACRRWSIAPACLRGGETRVGYTSPPTIVRGVKPTHLCRHPAGLQRVGFYVFPMNGSGKCGQDVGKLTLGVSRSTAAISPWRHRGPVGEGDGGPLTGRSYQVRKKPMSPGIPPGYSST